MQTWKQRARQLKEETYAIYIACKDSRVPWYARVFAGIVVGATNLRRDKIKKKAEGDEELVRE